MSQIEKFRKSILEIKLLKNKHKNKSCVIFGGGPSIDNIDVDNDFFKDKIIFTCNYKKSDIIADYHMLHDPLSIMWWKKNNVNIKESNILFSDIVLNFEKRNISKICKKNKHTALNLSHVRDRWLGDIPIKEYLEQLNIMKSTYSNSKEFYVFESPFWKVREQKVGNENFDIANKISDKWYGSGFLLIESAIYMGFQELYLSGFDGGQHHNYENNPSQRHYRMKNRTLAFWASHGERLKFLKNKFKIQIKLVNSPNSIYKNYIEEIKL